MHPVSAVIITKNEEKNIGRCMQALQQVAEEIIVVDSFSTDKTLEIAKSMGAIIFSLEWKGFGPQKNFGLQQATNNYILALDADEVLTDEAIKEIQQIKLHGFNAVYEFPLKNYFFGKFLRRRDYKKRMFDKTAVIWNDNDVHETLVIPENYPVIKLKGIIEHYSYFSIEHYIAKSNLYSTIAANELFKKGKKNYLFKMLFSPAYTFFQSYILKSGFLDGMHGFVIATFNGYTSFLKYAKLWELYRKEKKKFEK